MLLLTLRETYTLNRLSSFQNLRRKGGKFDHRPSGQRSCDATASTLRSQSRSVHCPRASVSVTTYFVLIGYRHSGETRTLSSQHDYSNWAVHTVVCELEKCKKLAHTGLPSVGFWSWSRFLAVSLQVTWVINPAVGCYYFPPGLQLALRFVLLLYNCGLTVRNKRACYAVLWSAGPETNAT